MNPQYRTSQEALSALQGFQSSRKAPEQTLRETEGRLGLPTARQRQVGLRSAISNTENLLRQVDPSVTGRTSGNLVTEAQRQRLVAQERQPLDEAFREQSRAFEGESANVAALADQAAREAQLAIGREDQQSNFLRSLYDTLFSREQAEEEKRRYEEAQRLAREEAERQRQAAARAASQNNYLAGLLGGGGGAAAPKQTDPVQQSAYNEVQTRIQSQSDNDLASDIRQTRISAGYGNKRDEMKLAVYYQLRPDLFNNPAASTSRAARPNVGAFRSTPSRVTSGDPLGILRR